MAGSLLRRRLVRGLLEFGQRWHRVVTTGPKWLTPANAPEAQQEATDQPKPVDSGRGVGAATRREPAGRGPAGAPGALVTGDRCDGRASRGSRTVRHRLDPLRPLLVGASAVTREWRPGGAASLSRALLRSRPSTAEDAVEVSGRARTTSLAPLGMRSNRSWSWARNRRETWCRITLAPTAFPTTNPTWLAPESSAGSASRYTTTDPERTRRPRLVTEVKSAPDRRRCAAGNTELTGSGRQFAAALAPAGLQDGASGTSPHSQTEAVGLGPAAVVRLEGPLAHGLAPSQSCAWCAAC
ncbi:MAG: hypothetical protein QOE23_207 [Pseudonocardiales bacterium]|nr:hypothetical protein [Pseudonocardiales bacterium]